MALIPVLELHRVHPVWHQTPAGGPQPWHLLCRAKLCTIWLLVFKSGPPLSPLLPVKLRKRYAIGLG